MRILAFALCAGFFMAETACAVEQAKAEAVTFVWSENPGHVKQAKAKAIAYVWSDSPGQAELIPVPEELSAQSQGKVWQALQASAEDPYPKVIDRITFPDIYPDFAFSGEDDLLEVWFCPVRDQDATIFLYQGQVWMLDCGDERALTDVTPLLEYLGVKQVDRLFNTHPHHDHLNGLYAVDAKVPVRELLICFPEDATVHMTAAMEYCKGNGIPVTHYEDESVFPMGDGAVTFLAWLKVDENESVNDRSGIFMISYGGCSLLSMGDMELRGQRQLYAALDPAELKADILRYPHHGKLRMDDDFFAAVDPDLAIVTNGPRIYEIQDSTHFLENKHVNAGYTRRNDHVLHLVTDGHHWLCEDLEIDLKPWTPSLRSN